MPVLTARLELQPLTAESVGALLARDAERLETLTRAVFPRPLVPPPLMQPALEPLRSRLAAGAHDACSGGWLIVRRVDRMAVGMLGCDRATAAAPVTIGYTLYLEYQGQGYATEAAGALVERLFADNGVHAVRATVAAWHRPSIRVLQKLGLRPVGTLMHAEAGPALVFERPNAPAGTGWLDGRRPLARPIGF